MKTVIEVFGAVGFACLVWAVVLVVSAGRAKRKPRLVWNCRRCGIVDPVEPVEGCEYKPGDWEDCIHCDGRAVVEVEGAPGKEWRCFFCDEVLTTEAEARQHFGAQSLAKPWCTVDVKHLRAIEKELADYRNENGPKDRQIMKERAEHDTALRRTEEKGYDRGLRDMANMFRTEPATSVPLLVFGWAPAEIEALKAAIAKVAP